jgi:eukaryotic-like serine/threonine-protein kinase
MPDPTPPRPAADRNLLFGILALQMDFIDREALVAAMNAWVLDKAKPLGQILLEQGKLRPEFFQALEVMVEAHLKAHDHDPQRSLAALSSVSSLRQELAGIETQMLTLYFPSRHFGAGLMKNSITRCSLLEHVE